MKINLVCYIDIDNVDINTIRKNAINKVNGYDSISDVIQKLYYISPNANSILIVVGDSDKDYLGVESNILYDGKLDEYEFDYLPNKFVEYKELMIIKDSYSEDSKNNIAQNICSKNDEQILPHKFTIVKVVDYINNTDIKYIINNKFTNSFKMNTPLLNIGDADAGGDVLEQYIRIEPVRSENERYIYDGLSPGNTYKLKFTLSGDVCTDASNKHLLAIGDASDNYIYTIVYFYTAEDIRLNSNANINVVSCKINGEDMVDKVSKYEDVIKDRNEVEVVFELKGENGTKLFINNCCDNHTYRAMTSSSLQNVLIKTI